MPSLVRDLGLVVAHVISEGFGRQVVNELLADAGEGGSSATMLR